MSSSPQPTPNRRLLDHPWIGPFLPFRRWWPGVDRATLGADLVAGLTGAVIVLPQGVAFATLAGLPPEYGLYAAMVPAVIGALFGSSWHLVSGPTNAISLVIFATLSPLAEPGSAEFIRLALTLTLLTGIFQLAMGLARLGTLVNFISHTVVVGFTAGAALLIIASQIKNFFGIPIARGASFAEVMRQFLTQLPDINLFVAAVSLVTLAGGIAFRRLLPRFPYMIGAMVVGSLAALALNARFGHAATGIATLGALPASLPPLSMPDFSPGALHKTAPLAFAVTLLALTEAVSIARSIAVKSGQRIDGNQEFVGQGLSNIFGAFFSGYASSGSFNRSGLNYEAGARTPLAAVFSAGFLVLILLVVAPLAAYLPIPAMAAILFLVAWGLIDFHHVRSIVGTSRSEAAVLAVTFIATLTLNLEYAIYGGVILSLILYLNRTSRPAILDVKPDTAEGSYHFSADTGLPDCPQLKILRINGSIFFGAVPHVQQTMQEVDEKNPGQKHLLLVATGVNFVDLAGAEMLAQEAKRRRKLGGGLYLYRPKNAVRSFLQRGHYLHQIGEQNLFAVKSWPVSAIYRRLDPEICRSCTVRIFRDCHQTLPNGEPRPPRNTGD
ncbi:MAG: SulP family inorganic anion transporter [Betaproteobacteria bacterium]|nr:SulP family inorganic anion transporter [Betaproteobacteria bacterium]